MPLDIKKIRKDFPALEQRFNNKPVIYFDNACVTLRPRQVIEAINEYYTDFPGCHNRAQHKFGQKTTKRYNQARGKIAQFINARSSSEVLFVRNATEAINLIANILPFRENDVVLTTELEHNSNFLPWQELNRKKKIIHKLIPLHNSLTFDMEKFKKILANEKVRLVSVFHTSNVTGYTLPAKEVIEIAHKHGALVLLDGAQSIAHQKIDIQELGADFFVFSFHKIIGPSGIGACYIRKSLLESLPQFLVGGETIVNAYRDSFIPADLPERFEAGLQDYSGALGSAGAIEYIGGIGQSNIQGYEYGLNTLLTNAVSRLPGAKIIGPADPALRGSIINFTIDGIDSLELARLLDETNNIMARAGMHCAHPWYNASGTPASLRLSVYFYNTEEEVDIFIETLEKIIKYFR